MEQIHQRVQKPGETVDEYYAELDSMFRKADPDYELSDTHRKRQFIRGLRRELREPVQMATPYVLQQALIKARAAEVAYSQDIPLSAYSLNRYYLNPATNTTDEFKKLQTDF